MNWPNYEKELPVWAVLLLAIVGTLLALGLCIGIIFALYLGIAAALGAMVGAFFGAFEYVLHLF